MLKHKIITCICVLAIICSISTICYHYSQIVDAQHAQAHYIYANLPRRHTLQQLSLINKRARPSRDAQYRIYSHHYLAIEHHDLVFLKVLGNHIGWLSNHVANDDFSVNDVYHKYHDGNYWSVFYDNRVPGNFRNSHMKDTTYYFINKRVLKAHGIYSGVNFSHKKVPVYSIDSH